MYSCSRWSTTIVAAVAVTGMVVYYRCFGRNGNENNNQDQATPLQTRIEDLERSLQQSQEELDKQMKLRQDERQGRIHAEKLLRNQLNETRQSQGFTYQVIGTVESPFIDRRGTPRQPLLVPAARALIRFNKKLIQKAHFEELNQFSHVWVIFVFHENTNLVSDQHQHQQGSQGGNNTGELISLHF
jgi:hypothetical protein